MIKYLTGLTDKMTGGLDVKILFRTVPEVVKKNGSM